ncbi:MAG: ATP-binding cassette domain-containing protein [Bacteroidota bacterium]
MLQTNNLIYSYDGQQVLRFPDFEFVASQHYLLLGQSGSGKTTLLHLLGGLRAPKSGEIFINDVDIASLSQAELDRFRGKHIGIIFQQSHFVRSLNVQENLILAQQLAGMAVAKDRIRTLLERLNVGHKLYAKTDNLSVGEQQRVAIARALVNNPTIILADEPTSALDDTNCTEVANLLEEEANKVGATLLIVTHDGRLKDKFEHQITLEDQLNKAL